MEQGETRSRRWQILVSVSSLVVLVAGVSGVVLLARHGRRIAVLVGLLAASAAVVVFGYGNTRFRSAAEPALLIGGAVCLTGLARMRAGSAKAQKPPTPQS
jgi:drug/metabolite transporter (DMT)-like permease